MKESIGIITWCKSYNYGEVLQAYAMQKVFGENHPTFVISYQPGEESNSEFLIKKTFFYKFIKCFYRKIKPSNYLFDARVNKFDCFRQKKMERLILCNSREEVVKAVRRNNAIALVCGSDVIWEKSSINDVFGLDFPEFSIPRMAYAPSMGNLEAMDDFDTRINQCVSWWKQIDYLSTREQVSSQLISELTGRMVTTVLDPTLLLNEKIWNQIASGRLIEEEYMFCYFIGGMVEIRSKLEKIRRQYHVEKVVCLKMPENQHEHYGVEMIDVGPAEFVSLIKYAKVICTDSYHGTLFSINFQKDFFVFLRRIKNEVNRNDLRIPNILKLLHIEEQLLEHDSVNLISNNSVDYEEVNRILQLEREKSNDYIQMLIN